MWKWTCMLLVLSIQNGGAAKIFSLFSIPMRSHQIVFRALTEALAPEHQQVVVTTDPNPQPPDNVTQIDVHNETYVIFNQVIQYAENIRRTGGYFQQERMYNKLFDLTLKCMDAEFEKIDFSNRKKEKFDLAIVESLTYPVFALGSVLQTPVIATASRTTLCMVFDAVGAPTHPMLYYDFARSRLDATDMWDRIVATIETTIYRYIDWTYVDIADGIIRKHFGPGSAGAIESMRKTDMLLLNVNNEWEGIRPIPPAVIFVGGLNVKPAKPLEKELQKFLDSSTRGVIYMSLGSNIRSADLPQEKIQVFLQVFSQLPYDVLWKWEDEELPGKSDNIHASKWWPQASILNHPNVKAFITHAGLHSIEEAIVARVPLVAVPFFLDQFLNSQRIERNGIGVALDFHTITVSILMEAVTKVTTNNKYHHNIDRLALILHDQPDTPALRVRWWTEYVLRHGGAGHLRAPAAGVSLATYLMLDVLAVVTVALLALVTTVFVLIRQVTRVIFGHRVSIRKRDNKMF